MAAKQTSNPKLSIIILNYNTEDLTRALVRTIGTHPHWEIIIVDNSPNPSLKTLDSVTYIPTGKNLGFSGGNNIGILKARGEWVLLLNSDIEITAGQIETLLTDAIAQNARISAPVLLNRDKSLQPSAGYFDGFAAHPINWLFARPRYITEPAPHPYSVDFANAAVLLIHRSIFETVGYLDDSRFFMYFEDIDFGMRLKKRNQPILYNPHVQVVHYGGSSSDQDEAQKNSQYASGLQTYVRKHRGIGIMYINNILNIFR